MMPRNTFINAFIPDITLKTSILMFRINKNCMYEKIKDLKNQPFTKYFFINSIYIISLYSIGKKPIYKRIYFVSPLQTFNLIVFL